MSREITLDLAVAARACADTLETVHARSLLALQVFEALVERESARSCSGFESVARITGPLLAECCPDNPDNPDTLTVQDWRVLCERGVAVAVAIVETCAVAIDIQLERAINQVSTPTDTLNLVPWSVPPSVASLLRNLSRIEACFTVLLLGSFAEFSVAFVAACEAGDAVIVAAFLAAEKNKIDPAPFSKPLQTAMMVAARNDSVGVMTVLLNDGRADPAADDNKALLTAVNCDHVDIVRAILLDGRADPSFQNQRALWQAAETQNLAVLALLLTDSRTTPCCSRPFFSHACWTGACGVVRLLLADGRVSPQENRNGALCEAAKKGDDVLVKLLLADVRVNAADRDNEALFYAARNGHLAVVTALLAHPGVDPRARNHDALFMAAANNKVAVVKALLGDGRADPAARDHCGGNTIFYDALYPSSNIEVFRAVLADGRANPAARDNLAIMYAAGKVSCLDALLRDGRADPTARFDEPLREALTRNCETGCVACLDLLLADRRVNPFYRNLDTIRRQESKGHTFRVTMLEDRRRAAAQPGVVQQSFMDSIQSALRNCFF